MINLLIPLVIVIFTIWYLFFSSVGSSNIEITVDSNNDIFNTTITLFNYNNDNSETIYMNVENKKEQEVKEYEYNAITITIDYGKKKAYKSYKLSEIIPFNYDGKDKLYINYCLEDLENTSTSSRKFQYDYEINLNTISVNSENITFSKYYEN